MEIDQTQNQTTKEEDPTKLLVTQQTFPHTLQDRKLLGRTYFIIIQQTNMHTPFKCTYRLFIQVHLLLSICILYIHI